MATVWCAFMDEFPWVCKLPLVDCLEMFWYYSKLNDSNIPDGWKDYVIKEKFPAFEQSVKDKEDIFKNKV